MISDLDIRRKIVEVAFKCGEPTHVGGSLSMVELLNVLFGEVLNHRPEQPDWPERDVFILSKGHAVLGYLAVLHLYGYFGAEKLATFQTDGSDLIAHPIKNIRLGIESSNGSLGQGLPFALGLAIGMEMKNENRRVYVMLGDGECNEGSVWEAAALAAERGTNRLCAIVDENRFRNDGMTTTYAQKIKLAGIWRAFGWNVIEIDGHDPEQIRTAFSAARAHLDGPTVIVASTIKGRGIDFMENNNDWHHNRITDNIYKECMRALNQELTHD
jgi:transketolase